MRNNIGVTLAVVGALAFVGNPAVHASSGDISSADSTDDVRVVEQPMVVSGYDEEVAKENGFRIDFTEEGDPYPVPVTEEARQQVLEGGPQTQDIVPGTCGISRLFVAPSSSTNVQIDTGYTIYSTFGKPLSHTWDVDGATSSGGFTENFSGLAPFYGYDWSASHNVYVGSSNTGTAEIRSGSRSYLNTGFTCHAEFNTDTW